MADVTLRDNLGRIVGIVSTDSRGVQTLRTQLGVLLGNYDPHTNTTRNAMGQIVGTGNLLSMLIKG